MSLTLAARMAERKLDVALRVPAGETVAVLGSNGAGKSTTLAIIAGLLRPDSGHAQLGSTLLFDVSPGAAGTWLPPHRRGISLLTQDSLLFPHLSVLDNVAFGPRSSGMSVGSARGVAREWLRVVEAADFAHRKPAHLSGGEAQRVALARALAADPRLILLDEPLAALDVAAAPALRRVLAAVLEGRSAVIVTHEVLDALVLARRVAVIHDGHVVETGLTREVFQHPRHPFTAELAGLNLVTGVGNDDGVRTPEGWNLIGTGRPHPGAQLAAAFAPSAVLVDDDRRVQGPNTVSARITEMETRNGVIRVRAGRLFADVAPSRAAELRLVPGTEHSFSVDPDQVTLYPLLPQP